MASQYRQLIIFPHTLGLATTPEKLKVTLEEHNKAYDPSGVYEPHRSWVEVEDLISRGWRITHVIHYGPVNSIMLIMDHDDE